MLIAQVSDTHIKAPGALAYRVVDTARALRACVDALRKLPTPPDVVVVTGDLVDLGRPEEYAHLRALLAPLPMPVFVVAGNHDDREALRQAFGPDGYLPPEGYLQYAVERWPVRLLILDTLTPGHGHGELCDTRLDWLERQLEVRPEIPTVVLMHHPPFLTGIGHMDRLGLRRGGERLRALVARHPQVERILCGHLHRSIQARVGGTIASTAPSPAHQVALDLRPDAASAFMLEPPGFQLHLWQPGAGVVSHTAVIGAYEGPYPFFEGADLIR